MKFIRLISFFFIFSLYACDNEIEINANFEEVTAVFGLLDARSDTQFIKITRSFLDDDESATLLARDPNNIYYDSLKVELREESTGNIYPLSRILLPKQEGIFTTERNEAYFTTEKIEPNRVYNLTITTPDNSVTTGITKAIDSLNVLRPRLGRAISFANRIAQIVPVFFEFESAEVVAEFEAELRFQYIEISNNDSSLKEMVFPLGNVVNDDLVGRRFDSDVGNSQYNMTFDSERLFEEIERSIPASEDAPRRILPDNNVVIEINSADGEYALYRDVYGPLDGLAQTRAEYTNLINGVGLFASRRRQTITASTTDDSENLIISRYGDSDNLAQFRNFQFP